MSAADCKTSPKWAKWAKMNNFPASYAKEVEKTCLEGVEKAKKGKVETVPLYTEEEMAKVAPVTEPVAVKPLDIVSNANTIKAVSMTSIVVFASLFL
jgi:hypothetical protein